MIWTIVIEFPGKQYPWKFPSRLFYKQNYSTLLLMTLSNVMFWLLAAFKLPITQSFKWKFTHSMAVRDRQNLLLTKFSCPTAVLKGFWLYLEMAVKVFQAKLKPCLHLLFDETFYGFNWQPFSIWEISIWLYRLPGKYVKEKVFPLTDLTAVVAYRSQSIS